VKNFWNALASATGSIVSAVVGAAPHVTAASAKAAEANWIADRTFIANPY
jgi:hypothetical protein